MEAINSAIATANTFIRGDQFFEWHGIVLSSCWLIGSVIAILARRVSVQLHAILFFLIDAATAFFIVGAMLRVYPHIQANFDKWDLLKKGHFIGGGVFLVLLVIQHIGGVSTLLKGMKFNSSHRKLGYVVSNLGRFIAIGGQIIGHADTTIIYASVAISVILFLGSTYKVFFAAESPSKPKPEKKSA